MVLAEFSFSAVTLVGRQESHAVCKNNWVLVCWWWRFDWSFATIISVILSSNKIQNGDILVPTITGPPQNGR